MGCGWLLALPFKIAGTLALAAGLLLVVSGYRIRHGGFCALGGLLGGVAMLIGWMPWWLGAATAIAGAVGFQKYRRMLPRR